jgi:hypothetical protein
VKHGSIHGVGSEVVVANDQNYGSRDMRIHGALSERKNREGARTTAVDMALTPEAARRARNFAESILLNTRAVIKKEWLFEVGAEAITLQSSLRAYSTSHSIPRVWRLSIFGRPSLLSITH